MNWLNSIESSDLMFWRQIFRYNELASPRHSKWHQKIILLDSSIHRKPRNLRRNSKCPSMLHSKNTTETVNRFCFNSMGNSSLIRKNIHSVEINEENTENTRAFTLLPHICSSSNLTDDNEFINVFSVQHVQRQLHLVKVTHVTWEKRTQMVFTFGCRRNALQMDCT